MKYFIFFIQFLFLSSISFSQWSNYYIDHTINKDTLNIRNIDYGQLAEANAQQEKIRLETLIYSNEQEKIRFLEVASTPTKAFDYGVIKSFDLSGVENLLGFWKISNYSRTIPHKSLFTDDPNDVAHLNISSNNIQTELFLGIPTCPKAMSRAYIKKYFKLPASHVKAILSDVESYANMHHLVENEYSEDLEAFIHNKDIQGAKIFGKDGFMYSVVYEDESKLTIKDSYIAVNTQGKYKVVYYAAVTYSGNKDEITFEDLEGRRHYLKNTCEQFITFATFECRIDRWN